MEVKVEDVPGAGVGGFATEGVFVAGASRRSVRLEASRASLFAELEELLAHGGDPGFEGPHPAELCGELRIRAAAVPPHRLGAKTLENLGAAALPGRCARRGDGVSPVEPRRWSRKRQPQKRDWRAASPRLSRAHFRSHQSSTRRMSSSRSLPVAASV